MCLEEVSFSLCPVTQKELKLCRVSFMSSPVCWYQKHHTGSEQSDSFELAGLVLVGLKPGMKNGGGVGWLHGDPSDSQFYITASHCSTSKAKASKGNHAV